MHDPFDAIRRLYGEPGEPAPSRPLGSEASAEARAMADMKEALDRLPPRSPDAATVDAVVAAAAEAAREAKTTREAVLEPIRAAYGEEPLPSDADAETRALAAMKATLDALPPQRPDASLIDAVMGAASEARQDAGLVAVRTIYDEEPAPPASAEAETEARALAPIKAALDRLPPRRPGAAVIDAVVAAASSARPASAPATSAPATTKPAVDRAADRPARPSGAATRRRIAAVLGTVFALVVVFGGGLWLMQDAPSPESAASDLAVAERPADIGEPESPAPEAAAPAIASDELREAAPPPSPPATGRASVPSGDATGPATAPTDDLLAASAQRQAAPVPTGEAPSVASDAASGAQAFAARAAAEPTASGDFTLADAEAIAREDDDELRLLYLRLRQLQAAQAGLGWDDPPVALGAVPDSATAPTAPTGWMQVRVDR